MKILSQQQHAS